MTRKKLTPEQRKALYTPPESNLGLGWDDTPRDPLRDTDYTPEFDPRDDEE